MNKQAECLDREHVDAVASVREGLHETFTVNAPDLPPTQMRCLSTTNIIENHNGVVRHTSGRVTRYRDADTALRWTPAGSIEAQESFRKTQGIKDLWMLKAAPGRPGGHAHNYQPKLVSYRVAHRHQLQLPVGHRLRLKVAPLEPKCGVSRSDQPVLHEAQDQTLSTPTLVSRSNAREWKTPRLAEAFHLQPR